MKVLALTSPSGGVAIMRLLDADAQEKAISDFSKVSFAPVSVVEIAEADVPKGREFRDAWVLQGGKIGHDLEKAKAVHADKIRAARTPMLLAADVEIIRRMELGLPTNLIAAEKQRLRDAPTDPRIAAARSIDELKEVWPL